MSKVVLTGEIEFADIKKYEELVAQPNVTEIDISQFSISGRDYEAIVEELDLDDNPLTVLTKLILNKEFTTSFVVENGAIYSTDKKVLIHYSDFGRLTIPYGVEIIGHYAFYGCSLESVLFPLTLKQIGNRAFEYNDFLKEVALPNSVTKLGECCFASCGISDILLSNNLKNIPGCCFLFNELNFISIPSSVKKIESSAFDGNFIKRVVFQEGLESIANDAFSYAEYFRFPSTMREIDKEFFCETPIVDP